MNSAVSHQANKQTHRHCSEKTSSSALAVATKNPLKRVNLQGSRAITLENLIYLTLSIFSTIELDLAIRVYI